MSALDQAFIKAYGKEREASRPANCASVGASYGPDAACKTATSEAPVAAHYRFDFAAGLPAPSGPIWPWLMPAASPAPAAVGAAHYARVAPGATVPALPTWGPWGEAPWRFTPAPTGQVPPFGAPAHFPLPASLPERREPAEAIIRAALAPITAPEKDLDELKLAELDLAEEAPCEPNALSGLARPSVAEPCESAVPLAPCSESDEDEARTAAASPSVAVEKDRWLAFDFASLRPSAAREARHVARAAETPSCYIDPAPIVRDLAEKGPTAHAAPSAPRNRLFEPQWEVERFAWPAMCDTILSLGGDLFATLVEQALAAAAQGQRVIAIAGCSRGDGKSTLALCLAREAARAGVSVALVDADFEHPTLGESLGVAAPRGWDEALDGALPLTETSVASAVDTIHLFPLCEGRTPPDAEQNAAIAESLELLATRHDLVLVDMGTIPAAETAGRGAAKATAETTAEPYTEPSHPEASHTEASPIAAIIVRDCRTVAEPMFDAVVAQLRAAGVEVIGRADNFRRA